MILDSVDDRIGLSSSQACNKQDENFSNVQKQLKVQTNSAKHASQGPGNFDHLGYENPQNEAQNETPGFSIQEKNLQTVNLK